MSRAACRVAHYKINDILLTELGQLDFPARKAVGQEAPSHRHILRHAPRYKTPLVYQKMLIISQNEINRTARYYWVGNRSKLTQMPEEKFECGLVATLTRMPFPLRIKKRGGLLFVQAIDF
jgi:hypothetical protein